MTSFDVGERGLSALLRPASVPPAAEVWPGIRTEIVAREGRDRARAAVLRAVAVVAGLVLLSSTAVLAGSPDLRTQVFRIAWSGPRITSVEQPRVERQAITGRCGEWNAAGAERNYHQQVRCVAETLVPLDASIPWTVAVLQPTTWGSARQTYRLGSINGPPEGRPIWVVRIEQADGKGAFVLLDTETGQPYAIVRLAPTGSPSPPSGD